MEFDLHLSISGIGARSNSLTAFSPCRHRVLSDERKLFFVLYLRTKWSVFGDSVAMSEPPLADELVSHYFVIHVKFPMLEIHDGGKVGYQRWRRWWHRWSSVEKHSSQFVPRASKDDCVDLTWSPERAGTVGRTVACDEESAISYVASMNEKLQEDTKLKKRLLVSLCKSLMRADISCPRPPPVFHGIVGTIAGTNGSIVGCAGHVYLYPWGHAGLLCPSATTDASRAVPAENRHGQADARE